MADSQINPSYEQNDNVPSSSTTLRAPQNELPRRSESRFSFRASHLAVTKKRCRKSSKCLWPNVGFPSCHILFTPNVISLELKT
jgi:hypothetical protein